MSEAEELRPAGGNQKEFMYSTQSTGKPKVCLEHREIGGGKRNKLEKYGGPRHSGIFSVPFKGMCSAKEKSLQDLLSEVMKRLSFTFRKVILVGCMENEQRGHM